MVLPDYPSGGRIAFQSDRDGNDEIYIMGCDGTGQVNLTNYSGTDKEPSWSSGGKLAFSSDRNAAGGFDIYLLTLDPWGVARLTTDAANDESPALSPDGSKVAFVSYRDGNAEIYVLDISGKSLTRITDNAAADNDPAWSPDGAKIAFASDRDGNFDIYEVKPDGAGFERIAAVSDSDANDRWPDLAADHFGDEYIAFASDRDGDWEINYYDSYDVSQASSNIDGTVDAQASWSKSAEQMVYHTGNNDEFDIYKALYDGSSKIDLTRQNGSNNSAPDWEPVDGVDYCAGD